MLIFSGLLKRYAMFVIVVCEHANKCQCKIEHFRVRLGTTALLRADLREMGDSNVWVEN